MAVSAVVLVLVGGLALFITGWRHPAANLPASGSVTCGDSSYRLIALRHDILTSTYGLQRYGYHQCIRGAEESVLIGVAIFVVCAIAGITLAVARARTLRRHAR